MVIKKPASRRDIYRNWLSHQIKRDPSLLTRRDFLERGILGYTSIVLGPSLGLLQPRTASAEVAFKPLITLDLSGGSGFGPEVVFVDRNRSYLPSYSTLGRPENPMAAGTVTTTYGAAIWTNGLLAQAIATNASATVRANLQIAVLMHPNNADDSRNNPTLATHQVGNLAAQMNTSFKMRSGVAQGANSLSGGYSKAAREFPGFKPASGSSLSSLQNLVNVAQGPLAALTSKQLVGMVDLSGNLSKSGRVAARIDGSEMAKTFGKGMEENRKAVMTQTVLDPRQDPVISSAFGITAATSVSDPSVVLAANIKAVTDGYAPHAIITRGGYDYHNGTNAWKTDQHPKMIDMTIRILNAFAAKNQSVILQWNTDGAIKYRTDSDEAAGDFNEAHSGVMFVLSMNGGPKLQRFYLGSFNSGQVADNNATINLLGKNPANEGHAIFANILGLNGITDFAPHTPANLTLNEFRSFNLFSAA